MHKYLLTPLFAWLLLSGQSHAGLEWVRVADDKRFFVPEESGKPFVPWGFSYDHQDGTGQLLEEYWDKEWARSDEST